MGNQLSVILCLPLLLSILYFGVDLVSIQAIYSSLDAISNEISYKISTNGVDNDGNVDKSIDYFLKNNYDAYLIRADNLKSYKEGDFYPYYLVKEYKPIVISSKPLKINIKRYAILGIQHS